MRKYTIPQSMSVEYLVSTSSTRRLSDHLGSTSITTDADGNKVSEMRYTPWGEVRSAWTAELSTTPVYQLTKYTFTGQYSHMDDPTTENVTEGFGLMYYGARFYDPALGRFTSADTIIPSTQGAQGWDRYAYVNNNPVRYSDPTGHICVNDDGDGDVAMAGNCGGGANSNYNGGLQGPGWNNGGSSGDDDSPTPGEILDDLGLGGPTNEMIEAVNEYMRNNPNYNPAVDPLLGGWSLIEFSKIRSAYWANRAHEAGICSICVGEGARLHSYYDMRQIIMMTGWDASKVNWQNVGLDSVATVLSFIALNEVAQVLNISSRAQDAAAIGAGINGIRSGAESYANNDGPGLALAAAGLIPGPVGGVASAGSVFKDLTVGYYIYWTFDNLKKLA